MTHDPRGPRPAPSGDWCSRLDAGGTLQLFCFPHAGATSHVFRSWARRLPPHVDLWGVHPPGRGQRIREQPFRRIEPLVEALAASLPIDADRPFALFGHSIGALVAFETARCLRRTRGIAPRHLFASGYPAPHQPPRRQPLHDAPRDVLIRALERYEGIPPDLLTHAELMDLLLPAVRADFELSETYVYRQGDALPCGITCFGGHEDAEATPEELRGWAVHTTSSFELHILEGNHFFPFQSAGFLPLFETALRTLDV